MKKEELKIVKALDKLFEKHGADVVKPILQRVLDVAPEEVAARCPAGFRWSAALGRCLEDPID